MIDLMPRTRPPHLLREVSRHGKVTWVVRIGHGPRKRILGEYGSQEFLAAYQAAIAGDEPTAPAVAATGSLQWLIKQYMATQVWAALSSATRRQRENIFERAIKKSGRERFTSINEKSILAAIDARRGTPSAAKNFLQTMRGLFEWAKKAGHVTTDPTSSASVARPKTDGHESWTDEMQAKFERRWPLGTRERVAYAVLLYTGLRRGDAVRFGRPHVKDGMGTIRTEKTGEAAYIPICDELDAAIAAGPIGELTYIAGNRGGPMTKESFGNWFRGACNAAGVDGSAHGLRKTRATWYAERGATEAELDAMFGWRGRRMAALYTEKVNREKLARQASDKVGKQIAQTKSKRRTR